MIASFHRTKSLKGTSSFSVSSDANEGGSKTRSEKIDPRDEVLRFIKLFDGGEDFFPNWKERDDSRELRRDEDGSAKQGSQWQTKADLERGASHVHPMTSQLTENLHDVKRAKSRHSFRMDNLFPCFVDPTIEEAYRSNFYLTKYSSSRRNGVTLFVSIILIVLAVSLKDHESYLKNTSKTNFLLYFGGAISLLLGYILWNSMRRLRDELPLDTCWLMVGVNYAALGPAIFDIRSFEDSKRNDLSAKVAALMICSFVSAPSLVPVVRVREFMLLSLATGAAYIGTNLVLFEVSDSNLLLLLTTSFSLVFQIMHIRFENMERRISWVALVKAGAHQPFLSPQSPPRPPKSNLGKALQVIGGTKVHCTGGIVEKDVADVFERVKEDKIIKGLRIDWKKIEVRDLLGKGAIGEVYEALYCDMTVAVKRISCPNLSVDSLNAFRAEVHMLNGLRHPNVVQIMGVAWDENLPALDIVMELLGRGSLRSVLQDFVLETMSWEDPKCKLALDACKGMTYLHENGVIHRDLKADNLLVSTTFTCKISDFGTSRHIGTNVSTQIGTPFFRAPEVLRAERYTEKADVYSFALVLLEMILHRNPFDNFSRMEAMEFPFRVAHEGYRLPIPEEAPEPIKRLIHECWQDDPQARPSFLLIKRRLAKFYDQLQGISDENITAKELGKLMLDQIIMSQDYRKREYSDGEKIIEIGDVGDECYIVLKGSVVIYVPSSSGKNAINETEISSESVPSNDLSLVDSDTSFHKLTKVATLTHGEYFGEMGLMAHTERAARCVAQGNVTCLLFSRDTFQKVFDSHIQGLLASRIVQTIQASRDIDEKSMLLRNTVLDRVNTTYTMGKSQESRSASKSS